MRRFGPLVTLCNTQALNHWAQEVVDLTSTLAPYRGQRIRLTFIGVTDAVHPSASYLDAMSLKTR